MKLPVPDEAVTRGVTAGTAPFTVSSGPLKYRVVPLPSEPRCKGCHRDPGETMRGALVVAFDPTALDGDKTLLMASETSLQHVMLSGLGGLSRASSTTSPRRAPSRRSPFTTPRAACTTTRSASRCLRRW